MLDKYKKDYIYILYLNMTMQQHKYSFIIPVYNRPDEVDELLDSITKLEMPAEPIPFEVIIVEDGSTIPCKDVVDKYNGKVDVRYFVKDSGGPAAARTFGIEKAIGDYIILTDSDCILPEHYLIKVNEIIIKNNLDAFGGADTAHTSFSMMQKAISYAMTSFLTTGGIRNKKKSMAGEKYYPKSYNLGFRKEIFNSIGGFPPIHPGEDTEFSINLVEKGYKVEFIDNIVVFHKRRTTLKKYFKQVFLFGRTRIYLNSFYPKTAKIVFCLPSLFVIASLFFIIASFICIYAITPILLYALLVLIDSSIKNKNVYIGFLSVITAFIQHFGYGSGFLIEFIWRDILGKKISKQYMKGYK
jgi:glycosyltransferase involved in cell wall biosynthesis